MKGVPKKFVKWFNSHFLDERDIIDIEQEYDRELTIEENQEAFEHKFRTYYYENPKEIKRKVKFAKGQAKTEERKNLLMQRKSYLEERFGIKLEFVG